MNKLHLIFFIAILFSSCTKEVFVIEEPEKPVQNSSPGDFNIEVKKITDTSVELSWSAATDPENENVSYQVAVNDSVIGYDIPYTYYQITGLIPGENYKIEVIASDKNYNIIKKQVIVETYKSFFDSFYSFSLGYDEPSVLGCAATSDGGFIICGVGNPYNLYRLNYNNFVAKINPDYSIAWHKKFEWDLNGGMSVFECSDGNYVAAWTNTVVRLNMSGDEIWKYKCPSIYNIESLRLVEETENEELVLYGVKLGGELKQSIVRLNKWGKEVLHESGGIYPSSKSLYVKNAGGETLVLGKTGKISEDGVFKLTMLDKNGKLLRETVYPNKFNGTDLVHSIMKVENGNYMLFGSTYGYVNVLGIDFCPHIIKIDSDGKVIWEKFILESETGGGFFRTIQSVIKTGENNYLIYIFDDRGFALADMNDVGEITRYKRVTEYPNTRHFSIRSDGKYVSLTDYGVIVFNPDGYVE
jgi:hypothetical protein